MGNGSADRRMVTKASESDGGGAAEVGAMTGDIKSTRTLRLVTSGNNSSKLEGKEIAESGAGSS